MTINSDDLTKPLDPWIPLLPDIFAAAFADSMAAQLLLGETKRVERATDMKRAVRNRLTVLCDAAQPFLQMVQARECESFDYVRADWDGASVALRWARFATSGTIRRNDTLSTQRATEQGALFTGAAKEADELPLFSIGYTIEDDYSLGGVSQAWLRKLLLCREWADTTDVIRVIHEFEPLLADDRNDAERLVERTIRSRAAQDEALRQAARRIKESA